MAPTAAQQALLFLFNVPLMLNAASVNDAMLVCAWLDLAKPVLLANLIMTALTTRCAKAQFALVEVMLHGCLITKYVRYLNTSNNIG